MGEEELQLQLALAMSKEDYDEELRRQKSDDIKLQMAIAESQRHAEVEVRRGDCLLPANVVHLHSLPSLHLDFVTLTLLTCTVDEFS